MAIRANAPEEFALLGGAMAEVGHREPTCGSEIPQITGYVSHGVTIIGFTRLLLSQIL